MITYRTRAAGDITRIFQRKIIYQGKELVMRKRTIKIWGEYVKTGAWRLV